MSSFNTSIYLYSKTKQQRQYKSVNLLQKTYKQHNPEYLLQKKKREVSVYSLLQPHHLVTSNYESIEDQELHLLSMTSIKQEGLSQEKKVKEKQQNYHQNYYKQNQQLQQPSQTIPKKTMNIPKKSLKNIIGEFIPKIDDKMQIQQNLQMNLRKSFSTIKSQNQNPSKFHTKLQKSEELKHLNRSNCKKSLSFEEQNIDLINNTELQYDDRKYKYNKLQAKTFDNKQDINLYRLYNNIKKQSIDDTMKQSKITLLTLLKSNKVERSRQKTKPRPRKFNWIKLSKDSTFNFINF